MSLLILPKELPVRETLHAEGIDTADCAPKGCEPLRILFLNLMPEKQKTELDICRAVAKAERTIELILLKISGQTYKTTPQEYMEQFYRDFETVEGERFDGLIITGAPLEHLPFEEVRYWQQLCHIMNWADSHVNSTLYICWAAQAGLYHHYGIPKYGLPHKKFGVYPHQILNSELPLFCGMPTPLPIPTSRHTEVRKSDFTAPHLHIVSESEESGVGIAISDDAHRIFITGHLEYAPGTLESEYLRDLAKNLPIAPPEHYYHDGTPESGIHFSWQQAAARFYSNWINHYAAS